MQKYHVSHLIPPFRSIETCSNWKEFQFKLSRIAGISMTNEVGRIYIVLLNLSEIVHHIVIKMSVKFEFNPIKASSFR